MNLHEAAEIARLGGTFGELVKARSVLADTMLDWLDPTPISEKWLRENGVDNRHHYSFGELIVWETICGRWATNYSHYPIDTIGELRTLLRLMGGGE
jgi:hypothetical protein